MLPTLSMDFAGDSGDTPYASAFDREGVVWCSRGCDALALVYHHASLISTDTVLLPTFHCLSIADTTRKAGLQVRFYRVNSDLTPNDGDIANCLRDGARALLLIHYFGFMQNVKYYRELCDDYGALLIEDCAHTLFGQPGRLLPGESGHYAIASQRKLLPVPDGGAAMANPGLMTSDVLRHGTFPNELRSAYRALQQAADSRTLGRVSRPLSSVLRWVDRRRNTQIGTHDLPITVSDGWIGSSDTDLSLYRESAVARRLRRATNIARLARIRRRNFEHLVTRLQHFPGCRPLFPTLPSDTVPYVVPTLIPPSNRIYEALRSRSVPVYRWEGLEHLGCTVTATYNRTLLQLPCHQELTTKDIDWIADQLRDVLVQAQR